MPLAAFEALNERAGGGGPAPLRQPPQHRRPARCARRTRRSPPAAACASGPTSSARSRAARPSGPTPRRSSGWARWASRSTRSSAVFATLDGGLRVLPALAGAPPRPRLRDRRRGREGRRPRPRGTARLHVQGAALGDRLQVPARGAHHAAARHPGVDRPHRQGHAVRRARAGVRRRLDRRPRHAAQRGPGARRRTCAPATPSSCARPATSSPRSSARCCRRGPRACRAVDVPHRRARSAARRSQRLEGESDTFCTNVDCPAQRAARIEHFASRGAMDIEGFGEQRVRLFLELGLLADLGDIYTLDFERGPRARGLRRGLGAQPRRRHRGVQGPPARQPARRPQHPPPRRRRRPAPGPATSATSTGILAASEEEIADGRGHRARRSPRRWRGFFANEHNRALIEKLRARRRQLRGARAARPSPRSWPACRSSSPARSRATAGRGPRRPSRPAGGKSPGRVSKKTTAVVVGRRAGRVQADQGRGARRPHPRRGRLRPAAGDRRAAGSRPRRTAARQSTVEDGAADAGRAPAAHSTLKHHWRGGPAAVRPSSTRHHMIRAQFLPGCSAVSTLPGPGLEHQLVEPVVLVELVLGDRHPVDRRARRRSRAGGRRRPGPGPGCRPRRWGRSASSAGWPTSGSGSVLPRKPAATISASPTRPSAGSASRRPSRRSCGDMAPVCCTPAPS